MISEYRWVEKKQKAMNGAAMGMSQVTSNATLTNAIAVADFVSPLIRYGMGEDDNIEIEFRSITAIKNGSGAKSKYLAVRNTKSRCRISSLVGDPPLLFAVTETRDVTRSKIADTAIRLTMLKATP